MGKYKVPLEEKIWDCVYDLVDSELLPYPAAIRFYNKVMEWINRQKEENEEETIIRALEYINDVKQKIIDEVNDIAPYSRGYTVEIILYDPEKLPEVRITPIEELMEDLIGFPEEEREKVLQKIREENGFIRLEEGYELKTTEELGEEEEKRLEEEKINRLLELESEFF